MKIGQNSKKKDFQMSVILVGASLQLLMNGQFRIDDDFNDELERKIEFKILSLALGMKTNTKFMFSPQQHVRHGITYVMN